MSVTQEFGSIAFFKNIIEKEIENDVEIKNMNVSYVVSFGENFTSELLRVIIKFSSQDREKSIAFITKRLNESIIEYDNEMGLYNCELAIYHDILPVLNKLEYAMKIAPKLYYLSKQSKYLVIEDLSASNYSMLNSIVGLDLKHCLLTMEKLAYFHASSLIIHEENPKIMDHFNKGGFSRNKISDKILPFMSGETLKVCQREQNLKQYYSKIKKILTDKIHTLTERDSKLNVLNHGDLWCNNLMFQYDDDKNLKDVLFVDFQLCVFTTPFLDIHYFMAFSTNLEVKQNYINTVLEHYYDTLSKYFGVFKLKTILPSWEEFYDSFVDKAYIGLVVTCSALHIFKADKRKDASLKNYFESDGEGSYRHHCHTNSNYLSDLEVLLSFYDSLGIFNG